ncbi:hypothetical protein ANN_15318 [Periplaneta americana]|uniref:Uncharacterized protein n=1 Tax=Periplaneta americana TaxID=6978 RepID=A0ABQ8SG17_PERAM|nr:hypothetical protein ANN_15318 [Periplaneta americana]
MAGLCEGGNEPSGSLKAICKRRVRREIRTHDQRPAREQIARAPRSTEGRRAAERREGKGPTRRGESARAAATRGVKGERTLPNLLEKSVRSGDSQIIREDNRRNFS